MTGWQVVLLVIAALGLLLWAPVVLWLRYDGQLEAQIRYLFIKKTLLPAPETPERPKRARAKGAKRAAKPQKPPEEEGRQPSPVKQVLEYADLIPGALGSLNRAGRFLLRHTTIKPFILRMVVAEGDAADTGVAYGRANAAVYTAYALLSRTVRMGRVDIRIAPDFLAREGWVTAEGCVRLSPGAALGAGLLLLGGLLAAFLKRPKIETQASRQPAAAAAPRKHQ